MTHQATPLSVCRRVREYAADFSNSMSAALLLNTDHEVPPPPNPNPNRNPDPDPDPDPNPNPNQTSP